MKLGLIALMVAGCAPAWRPVYLGSVPAQEAGPLAYVSNSGGDWDIWIVPPGGAPRNLTTHRGGDWGPAFSPDGAYLYFFSERDGGCVDDHSCDLDLFRVDPSGGTVEHVTRTDRDDERDPAPSFDGRFLAFVSDRDGDEEIFVMSLRSGLVIQVTFNDASDREPFFAPDGEHVVFVSDRDGNPELYVTDVAGVETKRITRTASAESGPCVSPDGLWYAFASNRVGHNEVYVMNAHTGETRCVTRPSMFEDGYGGSEAPCFSPSGDVLAFDVRIGSATEVYSCTLEGTRLRRMTDARLMLRGSPDRFSAVTNGVPAWGPAVVDGH